MKIQSLTSLISLTLAFFCILSACNSKSKKVFVQKGQIDVRPGTYPGLNKLEDAPCKSSENYIPNAMDINQTPMRYVRVNFHIINNNAGNANFGATEGRQYVKDLVRMANDLLSNNAKMNLPIGNNTPALPTQFRYVITGNNGDDGIYFHTDEELVFLNKKDKRGPGGLYSHEAYNRYGIRKGEVLNIFMLEHHPDSVASPTYNPSSVGIGRPEYAKITMCYLNWQKTKNSNGSVKKGPWWMARLLNHEIGHSLGLSHSWTGNDGCNDTPPHANCWNYSKKPPCDTEVSNNVMDYNTYNKAWSPCQLGKIHYNMSFPEKAQYKNLKKDWCSFNAEKTVRIRGGEEIDWLGHKFQSGDIIIEDGGKLAIHCSVSMAKGSRIKIKAGGELILNGARIYNDCGDRWEGIQLISDNKKKAAVTAYDKVIIEHSINPVEL